MEETNMMSKTFDWKESYANYLWKNIPDLGALLIIDNSGEIIEKRTSNEFSKYYRLPWLKKIAKKVSLRFKFMDFHKELEGLQLTINVFKEFAMLVKSLNSSYMLIMIVPSVEGTLQHWITKNAQWWTDELVFDQDYVKELESLS
jgi:hypothetical protein